MSFVLLLLIFLTGNFFQINNCLSFDLTLNIDDFNHNFRFIQTTESNSNNNFPLITILDHDISNSTSFVATQTYQIESDENQFGFATVVNREPADSNLVFAMVQTFDGSIYDISPPMSISQIRNKRSIENEYIVRHGNSIVEHAYVTIEWNYDRQRREVNESEIQVPADEEDYSATPFSVSISNPIENMTLPSAENDTELIMNATTKPVTPRPIPEKSRHLYLELVAVVDSLVTNDVRMLLNKTELETIEILKLYYIHIFTGIEQFYRQSLIHETLDVHIRLRKIVFATDKHRLPWELYKNISSLTNPYRKTPNNIHLRPNITMKLLHSFHNAYTSNNFSEKYFDNTADHIMTFTRLDLAEGAGLAYVDGTCLFRYKYSIIQEDLNAHSVMITVAHELGHNLGLNHDEQENECDDPRFRYIMSPTNMNSADRRQVPYFSECSIKQLNRFVDETPTTCWQNKIVSTRNDSKLEKIHEIISLKLGQLIDIHQQCRLQYGPQAVPYISAQLNSSNYSFYEENICNQLKCFKKPGDDYMFWQDGAFDGTPCGESRVCQNKQCVLTNDTYSIDCPYGDLYLPIQMLRLTNEYTPGNMLCPEALNLLRSRGVDVTHLCSDLSKPFRRLCCEECKKHSIPECGDRLTACPAYSRYCDMPYIRINGQPVLELCAYTCGKCSDLPPPPPSTTTLPTIVEEDLETTTKKSTTTKKVKTTTPKPRKYVKPEAFTKHTCIDSADCSTLVKSYAKVKKNVKNWCTEHSTILKGHYFAERCPKYCSLCNITSECDEMKLCQNNGACIKNENGTTYQCLCSKSKSYYGTLCEHRQTCLDKPCAAKTEYCIQTQGENYVCLSKENKEQIRAILDGKK